MNYFQSTKKESGGTQPTTTVFWTNSDVTVDLPAFTVNVDISQHDNIKVKWKTSTVSPTGIQEVIIPTASIGDLQAYRSGISNTAPAGSRAYTRYLQADSQTLQITGAYSNGVLNTVNNSSLIITELAFIDGITL